MQISALVLIAVGRAAPDAPSTALIAALGTVLGMTYVSAVPSHEDLDPTPLLRL